MNAKYKVGDRVRLARRKLGKRGSYDIGEKGTITKVTQAGTYQVRFDKPRRA